MAIRITPETVMAVAEGIREFNSKREPATVILVGNRFESVLPQEYHDNEWYRAVEYGMRKAEQCTSE